MNQNAFGFCSDTACLRAADTLVNDHFCVGHEESVVLTVDEQSDAEVIRVLCNVLTVARARFCVLALPRLPFQGSLADPFIPEPVVAAVKHCDVWFDLTFPYMAGSGSFDEVMHAKRARYLLLGDITAAAFGRLYGKTDFDALFRLQSAADEIFRLAEGHQGRITTPLGTDLRFTYGRPASIKHRRAVVPGAQTIPGSAIFYPEIESVRGRVVLEAAFHEHYGSLESPITVNVDGSIQSVEGGGVDAPILTRSLLRASRGGLGHIIHLTVGLNPGALSTGKCFVEDIRVVGRNAIGLGLPWWLPGGGENHPDGVIIDQSLWIDDTQIIDKGRPLSNHPLAALLAAAEAAVWTKSVRENPNNK